MQHLGSSSGHRAEQVGYPTFDNFEQKESLKFGVQQEGGRSQQFLEAPDQPT
ncbi:MAG TPA: hypothetical protein VFL99_03155 [Segeticoccus sp.]|nr:hypothetical protein [Segeticoccus sp.]